MDYGAIGIYFVATAPVDNLNKLAPQIGVGTASGEIAYSLASAQLALPRLPSYFPKSGHIMPSFNYSLMGLVSICDTEWFVHFHKHTVTINDPKGSTFIQGWRDNKGAKIWRFSLCPHTSIPYDT